jgi:hypothetical protein
MKNWAVIEDDVVSNIIVWDGLSPLDITSDLVEIPEGELIDIGCAYLNGGFIAVAPTPLSPEEQAYVDARESAVQKLLALGLTLEEVQATFR